AWKQQVPDRWQERFTEDDKRFYSSAFAHELFPAMILDEHGEKLLTELQWGLVPRWCRDEKKATQLWQQTLNARSETVFEKPSYRASMMDRRCIIFMTGWF